MRASFDGKIAPIVNELACILPRSLVADAILFLSAGRVAIFSHAKEKQPSSCVFHSLKRGAHLLNALLAELANNRGGLTDANLDGRHVENKAGGQNHPFSSTAAPSVQSR